MGIYLNCSMCYFVNNCVFLNCDFFWFDGYWNFYENFCVFIIDCVIDFFYDYCGWYFGFNVIVGKK